MSLPSFLEPLPAAFHLPASPNGGYIDALHRSKRLSLSSHALWWPSKTKSTDALVIMIPGNPGLAQFYTPFLTAIYEKCNGTLPIMVSALVGHTPHIDDSARVFEDPSTVALSAQVEHLVDLVDAAAAVYGKIVLIGHSVGSWLALQVLRARPDAVDHIFLLFPTIAHIGSTPRGRSLSWLFHAPLPRFISSASYATRLIPTRLLAWMFSDWPPAQLAVLRSLLNSPSVVFAALTMAHDEMNTINEPDIPLLQTFSNRIHLYYGETDGWVDEQKALLLKELELHVDVKIAHAPEDIPHAFVINHGEELAAQCYEWLLLADVV
ncbi:hypothetical protein EIP91_011261 [Steccherinum ochraceum]|uniref:AB hydrolase-1 domain-containing protein n=1 Tax=Steccherinum ochraceum TaxID=92696 RepID=A0A4R0R206_9APHY|nr:hypothetical protein EIP91_011261 [Steccherinum ochraceum]